MLHQMNKPAVPYRLGKHDKVILNNRPYRAASVSDRGYVMARTDQDGLEEFFTHEDLAGHVRAGSLSWTRDFYLPTTAVRLAKGQDGMLTDLSELEQRRVMVRTEFCKQFLRLEKARKDVTRSDESMLIAIQEIEPSVAKLQAADRARRKSCATQTMSFPSPSPSTLRRWLRAFKEGGYVAGALTADLGARGNRTPRKAPEEWELVDAHARNYASTNRDTKRMVFRDYQAALARRNEELAAQGLPALTGVSYQTFRLRMAKILDPFYLTAARRGREVARRKFAIIHGGDAVLRPLEKVEMDECNISLQTLLTDVGIWKTLSPEQRRHAGLVKRVWVSVAIDCASRCVLGFRIASAPSSASAISTLEMVVIDKTEIAKEVGCRSEWHMHGTPEAVSTDNGTSFAAAATVAAANDLGATSHFPPAKHPEQRGRIERFFATVQQDFFHNFCGQTFSNVVEKGDYDSQANACIDLPTLERALTRWIVDFYHHRPHHELAGATPFEMWKELAGKYGVTPPPDPTTRRHIFGTKCKRRISGKGIRCFGVYYQSAELQMLHRLAHDTEVEVKVDLFDLGAISVKGSGGWIVAKPAVKGLMLDGVGCREWVAACRYLARRNADTAALTAYIANAAIEAIRAEAASAAGAVGLRGPVMDAEEMEKLHEDVFKAFDFQARGGEAEELPGLQDVGDGHVDADGVVWGMPPEDEPAAPFDMPAEVGDLGLDDFSDILSTRTED